MSKLELIKSAINNFGYVDVDRKNLEAIESEIRADERKKVIHEILTEYESAVKSDNEASMYGDMFPHHVDDFWMKLKAGDNNG